MTHLIRKGIDRDTEGAGETEIAQLQLAFPVDEKVLRFEISVENLVVMAECCALQELVHEASDGVWVEGAAISVLVHVLLEILFAVLEDEDKLCLGMDNVVQSDDVDMLELLHERDFADGC